MKTKLIYQSGFQEAHVRLPYERNIDICSPIGFMTEHRHLTQGKRLAKVANGLLGPHSPVYVNTLCTLVSGDSATQKTHRFGVAAVIWDK